MKRRNSSSAYPYLFLFAIFGFGLTQKSAEEIRRRRRSVLVVLLLLAITDAYLMKKGDTSWNTPRAALFMILGFFIMLLIVMGFRTVCCDTHLNLRKHTHKGQGGIKKEEESIRDVQIHEIAKDPTLKGEAFKRKIQTSWNLLKACYSFSQLWKIFNC
ncbi:hypothetical protein [Pyrococcus sp. NA2]|uniref:hypothetical protein n=1 Tax=Pyrococcus sp. (strain NA2) TaxID=342949 RepID=UPI001ED93982|nr:hypothetical protein [Pyrococcus sp. NA2]